MQEEARETIGEVLLARRKEMNLALKEVEGATSIRSNYLQAIEEGNIGKLISPVYAQGFIRQYAAFLGLDGEKLLRENHLQMPGMKQEFSYGIGTMETRGDKSGGIKWLPNVLWIALSVALILAAWFFAKFLEVI